MGIRSSWAERASRSYWGQLRWLKEEENRGSRGRNKSLRQKGCGGIAPARQKGSAGEVEKGGKGRKKGLFRQRGEGDSETFT